MSEFEIGQKVRVKENFAYTKDVVGKVGVIKFVRGNGKALAVEFEEPFYLGHDCDGKCAPKRGLWLTPSCKNFELVPESKFKVGDKVVYEGKRGKVYIVNEDFVHLRLDENEDIMYGCSDNLVEKLEDVQLQKGDIVEVINDNDGKKITGEIGKVIDINRECISVEFFNFIDGHSCNGLSKNYGHCWNIARKNLEFLKREPVKVGNRFQRGARYRYIGSELKDKYGELCILGMNGDYWKNVRFNDGTFCDCKPEDLIEPDKDFKWKKWSIVKVIKEIDTYNEMHRGRSLLEKQCVVIEEESPLGNIGVAFFENINGHDCDRQGPAHHCWRIEKKNLEYVGKLMSVEHDEKENVKGEEKIMFNVNDVVKYVGDEYPTRKNSKCTVVGVCNRSRGIYEVKFDDTFQVYVTSDNLKKLYTKKEIEAMRAIVRRSFTIKDIVGIYPNEEKRVVVVKFNDNEEPIRVNCSADDNFDLTIAVALAIAYKNAGSKNQFKKKIAEKTKVIKSKVKKETKSLDADFITTADAVEQAFDNMFVDSNNAFNKLLDDVKEIPIDTYGQKIKRARKAKGLSQVQLAALVGVVPSTICYWEKDKFEPETRLRKRLEKELGL